MSWLIKIMGLGSGVSWIVYAVVFGLGVAAGATPAYVWEHRAVVAAEAERDGAVTQRDVYKAQLDGLALTHSQDVANMNTCKAVLADQSDAIAHLQLSLTATNDSAAKYAAESDADLRTLSDRVAEQQAFIDKNPDRVCRLTPEMRQRAESRVWK